MGEANTTPPTPHPSTFGVSVVPRYCLTVASAFGWRSLMLESPPQSYYSATVEMWLDCGTLGRIPLAQTADTFVIPSESRDLPTCDACIIMKVDGHVLTRPVTLTRGM